MRTFTELGRYTLEGRFDTVIAVASDTDDLAKVSALSHSTVCIDGDYYEVLAVERHAKAFVSIGDKLGLAVKPLKTLRLTLHKRWFDMIKSGEKREEYRDIKPYWTKRLMGKTFDLVEFKNGYGDRPTLVCSWQGMSTEIGKSWWGAAPGRYCYTIKLGDVL